MEFGRARDELILSLASNVTREVDRVFRRLQTFIEREDMLSEGWIGAIQAVDGFEPGRGLKLQTLAEHHIRGRILDYLRRMDPVTRNERRKIRRGEATAPVILPLLNHELVEARGLEELATIEARLDTRRLFERAELSERQRFVVERRYWDWARDREIGYQLGVHPSRISQLHTRAISRMRAVSVS